MKNIEKLNTIEKERKDKVILLDYGIFSHRAIYALPKMQTKMPVDYVALNMMISALRKIGVEPTDTVILACDGRGSWRKDYEQAYKGNRKEKRESREDINWEEMWERINNLVELIREGTSWYVVKAKSIEADDWMAVASRYYKDKEVIIVSYDEDLEQCWNYSNVKLFSILKKGVGGSKGLWKIPPKNFNAYNLITKKIQKEASDNLTEAILSKQDYEKRKLVIDLLNLPDWVEDLCRETFDNLNKEDVDLNKIPYKTLREKIGGLYNDKSKVITYEYAVQLEEKRKLRKKKKKKK